MNDFMNNKYTNQQINKLLYLLNNEIVKSQDQIILSNIKS